MILPCIICKRNFEDAMPGVENHPYKGTVFTSHGNYGSTVFDEMNGTFLEVNICDDCLRANEKHVLFGVPFTKREVTYEPWKADRE